MASGFSGQVRGQPGRRPRGRFSAQRDLSDKRCLIPPSFITSNTHRSPKGQSGSDRCHLQPASPAGALQPCRRVAAIPRTRCHTSRRNESAFSCLARQPRISPMINLGEYLCRQPSSYPSTRRAKRPACLNLDFSVRREATALMEPGNCKMATSVYAFKVLLFGFRRHIGFQCAALIRCRLLLTGAHICAYGRTRDEV